jgi:hypothetical protein
LVVFQQQRPCFAWRQTELHELARDGECCIVSTRARNRARHFFNISPRSFNCWRFAGHGFLPLFAVSISRRIITRRFVLPLALENRMEDFTV